MIKFSFSVWLPGYEDAADYEHDQAPELVVVGGKGKGTVDQLVQYQACTGASNGEADYSMVVLSPLHIATIDPFK